MVKVNRSGPKQHTDNGGPVSIASFMCKTLERITGDKFYWQPENIMLSMVHYGFVKHLSRLGNFLIFFDKATHCMDKNKALEICFSDFGKYFDFLINLLRRP